MSSRQRFWAEDEDRELERRRAAGEPWAKVAVSLGRSVNACRKRLYCASNRRAIPQSERRGNGRTSRRTVSGDSVLAVLFPEDLHRAIGRAADREFVPMAAWIRHACRLHLQRSGRR